MVLSAVVSLALPIGVAVAAPPAPSFALEDRNNNGVFDGADVDITPMLLHFGIFHTDERHPLPVLYGVRRRAGEHRHDRIERNARRSALCLGWNNVLFSQPAGEIIYFGSGNRSIASAAAAVQWWMNSAPHRQQILTASHAHIGIGRAANAGETTAFWTVDFSGQSASGTSIDGGATRAWDLGFIVPTTP